jgi:uncharacterized phiE125 gp8 family phage protein
VPLTRLTALDGDAILPLADAKLHLRVTHTDEDSLIGSLRDAAIAHVERVSGVALAEADYRWTMRAFPTRVDLPMRPVTELGDVTYHDEDGTATTYADARLVENSVYASLTEGWPYANGYAAVEFTAGLTSPDDEPDLLAAVKLLLAHLYENRGAVSVGDIATELPLGVAALIGTHSAVLV